MQAILETIDSGATLSSSGTTLSSTVLSVGGLNLPLAPVNTVNVKADKLLAKYQQRLRHLNDMHAARKEKVDMLLETIKKPRKINLKDAAEEYLGKDSELRKKLLQLETSR